MNSKQGLDQSGRITRRTALGISAVGASAVLSACAPPLPDPGPGPDPAPSATPAPESAVIPEPTPSPRPKPPLPRFQDPRLSRVPAPTGPFTALPGDGKLLAWTVDDGVSSEVVAAYAAFAEQTGARLTLFATGGYPSWTENAEALRPLVASGQVQIGNHTWTHPDLTKLSAQGVVDELQRTHDLIGELYGVDARPFFRPPFGFYDERVLAAAAGIGYTAPTLWYGSLADSGYQPRKQIIALAKQWFRPQHIVIGHANFAPVTRAFGRLARIIERRALTPVTLNDVFTSEYHR